MIVKVDELVSLFETSRLGREALHKLIVHLFEDVKFLCALEKYLCPFVYINPYTKEYGVCFSNDEMLECTDIKVTEMFSVIKHFSS